MTEFPTDSPTPTTPTTTAPPISGRPRVLNNFKRHDICMYIAFGCGIESAARFVGCSPITVRREARRNPEFRDQLRRAQQDCEIGPLNTIRKAAHENWRASVWYLERMNPQQFGKKNVRYVTPEQLAAFAHQVVTAVLDDNLDEEARHRAMNKLETFVAQLDQQSPDRDPLAKLTRRRKQKQAATVGGVCDADQSSLDTNPQRKQGTSSDTNPQRKQGTCESDATAIEQNLRI